MTPENEALSIKVVVRRAGRGTTPFIWEINKDDMLAPILVSPEAFASMEAAYNAGRRRLAALTPSPMLRTKVRNRH
jgi:hypothetical protein